MLQLIPRVVVSLVFSNTCETCDVPLSLAAEPGVCKKCSSEIHWIKPPFCQICGRPLVHERPKCAECQSESFHFDRAFAPALYEGKIKSLLHTYKFKRRSSLRNFLAGMLLQFIENNKSSVEFDCLAAVPLDRTKRQERGFNQSALLTAVIAKKCGKPDLSRWLKRPGTAAAQSLLAKNERRKNVLGCFSVSDPVVFTGKNLLLIDDILTTGQTASECARVLKEAGAAQVVALAVARGL